MSHKEVEEYVLSMPNAVLDYPFGEGVAVYKCRISAKPHAMHAERVQGAGEQHGKVYEGYSERVAQPATQQSPASADRVSGSARKQDSAVHGEWKMFALISEKSEPLRLSLKCDPRLSEVLREKYESVMPGYHLNKKHWNTIVLSGQLNWDEIKALIRHSYDLVAKTKAETPEIS